jgi:PAS domain S-box-containing protein
MNSAEVESISQLDLLNAAFESTPVGMAFLTLDRQILRVNDALCAILGRTEEELRALGLGSLTLSDDRMVHADLHRKLISGEIDRYQLDKRYLHSDGRTVWTTLHVGLVKDRNGRPACLISQLHDITERVEATERVRWLAMHDSLTGLGNRALCSIGSLRLARAATWPACYTRIWTSLSASTTRTATSQATRC